MRATLLLLLLSGCSGVSHVCDTQGTCLETWRSVTAVSSVTVSQLRGPDGKPVGGDKVSATGGGVVSYFDPFASDVETTATEAKAVGVW